MASLVLRGGRIWDGTADCSAEAALAIDEGRITAVGGSARGKAGLDISGCTVIPGLLEAHAHLCFDATPGWKTTYATFTFL